MLSSFRKAYMFHYLIGFLFVVVCWIPTFLIPQEIVANEVFHNDSIIKIGFSNILLLNLLGLLVTLVSALVLNHLVTEYGMTGKLMTMGIYFFSFLSVSISSFTMMNPFILINFFLFFFIRNIYRLPNSENPVPIIFNSALMLSIASLYFFKIIFLFVIIWIGLFVHRSTSWRNFVTSIIGMIIPYLFIMTWYYWSDQLQDFMLNFSVKVSFQLHSALSLKMIDFIIILIIAAFLIVGVLKTLARLNEKNINLRRNLIITIYYLLATIGIFILFAPELNAALIIIIPAAVIMSNAYHDLRNYKWYNVSFTVLLFLIFINQYLKLFF
jgi:hypothetical protein